jgi:hypothetical protein
MSATQQTPPRRISRTVIAGATLVVVFTLIAFIRLRHSRQHADLVEQIKAVGGFITHDPPPSLQERITAYREGSQLEENYTAVRLYTADITGDWLHGLDSFSGLQITDLTLAETALTDADLAQLIAAHPLEVVELRAEKVGDEAVAALAGSPKLFMLQIRESPLNDGQFVRLPLEQLEELRIDDTAVTPTGLQELRRAGRLVRLTIDGRQLDESAARILSGLPALRQFELVGESVTDDHLAMLHAIAALEWVVLRRTAVTPDGIQSLQSALPKCEVERQ